MLFFVELWTSKPWIWSAQEQVGSPRSGVMCSLQLATVNSCRVFARFLIENQVNEGCDESPMRKKKRQPRRKIGSSFSSLEKNPKLHEVYYLINRYQTLHYVNRCPEKIL